jgi:nucleotide-binding universal stress UspA family protein
VAEGPRILLAHDLSAPAEQAAALILGARWPATTQIRLVTSTAGIGPPVSSFANLREARARAREVDAIIAEAHERLAAELRGAGLEVETKKIPGKPERAIVAEANRFGADLIVLGARGQGAIASAILGSVSRAVVENASCSVLVGRRPSVQRVLLAMDGSAPARFATKIVATWPIFADSEVLLMAVVEPAPRYSRAVLGTAEWRETFRDTIASSANHAFDVVEEALRDLDVAGRGADVDVRVGDVATEVAAVAREWPADLVTVGSGRRSFLQQLFVGSVPRNVLDSVEASVLVARPPIEGTQS